MMSPSEPYIMSWLIVYVVLLVVNSTIRFVGITYINYNKSTFCNDSFGVHQGLLG